MLWIYFSLFSLLPLAYGYLSPYYAFYPLGPKGKPCSKRKSKACMEWCDTEYYMCYGNRCHCVPVLYIRREGNSLESDKMPVARSRYYKYSLPRGKKKGPCSKRKRDACMNWCDTDYSYCYDSICQCVPVYLRRRDSGKSDKAPVAGNIDADDKKEALRHHIAHFCTNLDLSRQCIFKCMKTGKPAFCGKDHVCYCGHRYTPADDDNQYNATKAHSEFKDLNQKYFGFNYADDYDVN